MNDEERQRITGIFQFLRELDHLKNPVVRDIRYQEFQCSLNDLPNYPTIQFKGLSTSSVDEGSEEDFAEDSDTQSVLTVRRPSTTKCPTPPEELTLWIEPGWEQPEADVHHLSERNAVDEQGQTLVEKFEDEESRVSILGEWQNKRNRWKMNELPARAALRVFERVYEVWGRIEKEGESIELMVGNGQLQIPALGIDHPILLHRLSLSFKTEIPEFQFSLSAQPVELYDGLFLQIDSVDGNQKAKLAAELVEAQYHPLGDDDVNGFLRRLCHGLFAPNGQYLEDPEDVSSQGERIVVIRRPTLFLRKRTRAFSSTVDRILEDLHECEQLPESLLRIAGFESLVESAEVAPERGSFYANEDEEILLSKEANEEQLRIAKQLQTQGCVLVQGPPGTGKTHTIANLLGHLLAEGKSILVTAHTTKALRVLRQQVDVALQALCVSVLESDSESNQLLNQSVQEIANRLSSCDADSMEQEASDMADERKRLIAELKRERNRLRAARFAEVDEVVFGGQTIRPIDAARQVAKNCGTHDWIPSPVELGEPLPIGRQELARLYASNDVVSSDDETELKGKLPDTVELVDSDEFQQHCEDREMLLKQDLTVGEEFWATYGEDAQWEVYDTICSRLEATVESIVDTEPWTNEVLRAGYKGGAEKEVWGELVAMFREVSDEIAESRKLVLRYGPEIHEGADASEDEINLGQILEHVRQGGSLGAIAKLTHRAWFKTISRCRIEGKSPITAEHFESLLALSRIGSQRKAILRRWERQITPHEGPEPSELGEFPERTCIQHANRIETLLNWHDKEWAPLQKELQGIGFSWDDYLNVTPPISGEHGELERLKNAVCGSLQATVLSRKNALWLAALNYWNGEKRKRLKEFEDSDVVESLVKALKAWDVVAYNAKLKELRRIRDLQDEYAFRGSALQQIEKVAPQWASSIAKRDGIHGGSELPGEPEGAWGWRQMHDELDRRNQTSIEEIQISIDQISGRLRKLTAEIVERRTWAAQRRRVKLQEQQSLIGFAQTIRRIGRGTGKRVPQLLRQARELLSNARRAVPVWIMPLSRVFESFDPRENRFDVVVVDEASQADISALAAIYLGRQVIVVGDKEQVTPDAIGQNVGAVSQLIEGSLNGVPNKHLYDGLTSIYDLAETAFGGLIRLREHFRCVPDIIRFSDDLCYGDIRPLREPLSSPLHPALVSHRVNGGHRDAKSNRSEAEEIVALIAACIDLPEFELNEKDKTTSFGVISMVGDEQAILIETLLRERIPPDVLEKRRLLCGNAAQFQGDERDVIFVSMVDSSPDDPPLSLRQDGAKGMFKKRFNVAASRARNQLWVVHSLNIETDLKPGDIRRRLIEHAIDPSALARKIEDAVRKAESPFEKDVLERLIKAGYKVTPQWHVGAYRIDMVVEGVTDRLAIECDGERWHSQDQLEKDMQRQAILERLGWKFIRIRGSAFYRNPEREMEKVVARLELLGIRNCDESSTIETDSDFDLVQEVVRRAARLQREWSEDASDHE